MAIITDNVFTILSIMNLLLLPYDAPSRRRSVMRRRTPPIDEGARLGVMQARHHSHLFAPPPPAAARERSKSPTQKSKGAVVVSVRGGACSAQATAAC